MEEAAAKAAAQAKLEGEADADAAVLERKVATEVASPEDTKAAAEKHGKKSFAEGSTVIEVSPSEPVRHKDGDDI